MLIITILSLVAAVACGVIAWRTARREHLRSDARVAWLASAIDESAASEAAFDWPDEDETPQVRPHAQGANAGPASVGVDVHRQSTLQRWPLIAAASGLAAVLAVVVLIAMTVNRPEAPRASASARAPEALELLAMRYERSGTTLSVKGIVRNRSDAPADAINAVISAVDQKGQVIASGRATLPTLAPGDESLFVVTIPHVNDVARYRVSFRTSAGVVRHVDRRPGPASAAS